MAKNVMHLDQVARGMLRTQVQGHALLPDDELMDDNDQDTPTKWCR